MSTQNTAAAQGESLLQKLNPLVLKPSEWTPNPMRNVLAGLLIAFALIPESIAFSYICGVDPEVGLYASFILAVSIALTGGRPGIIAAATGAQALVVGPMLRAKFDPDGLLNKLDTADVAEVAAIRSTIAGHLFLAAVLTGIFQLIGGFAGIAKLLKFVPRSVMIGFVNALAILIFMEQFHHFKNRPYHVFGLVALGMAITYLFPLLWKAVPAALIATLVLTALDYFMKFGVDTVEDMGQIPSSLPAFRLSDIPFTADAIKLVAPYSLAMMIVGLVESLLSAQILDGMTGTHSDKDREARGQGIGNILAGLFGGMPGCALTGQSIVNTQQGGTTRLSTFTAGAGMLAMILLFRDFVNSIPMAALVSIMIVVCIATFAWSSITPGSLARTPWQETLVVALVMVSSLTTGNLGLGVVIGAVVSLLLRIGRNSTKPQIETSVSGSTVEHKVTGALFYSTVGDAVSVFEDVEPGTTVKVDMAEAEIHDTTAVEALDALGDRLKDRGSTLEISGFQGESAEFYNKLHGTLGAGH